MTDKQPTLLVTGASGHLGRRVLELLLEVGAGPIIATTRTPDKLADFAARGVTVRRADFDDAAALTEAFAGADRLLIISTEIFGEIRQGQHFNAVKAAEQAGVSHVLYTSLSGLTPDSPIFVAPDHYKTEQAIAAMQMGYTFLRNNIYADYQIPALNQALKTGTLFSAAGDGRAAYVTREDCARAAAAALAAPFDGRRILDVTGPEAVSQADLAAIASRIAGRAVTYVPVEPDVLVSQMVAGGLPEPLARGLVTFDVGIAQGLLDAVSTTVADLTGNPPISMSALLSAHSEALLAGV